MKYFVAVRWATVLRPALVVGTFIGVVVTGTLVTREPAAPPTELASAEATPEEVEKALNEAKWALSFLSGVGRQTATTIRDGVLDEYVVQPVNRALSTAFDEDSRIQ